MFELFEWRPGPITTGPGFSWRGMLQDSSGGRILLCVLCLYFHGKDRNDLPADVIINGFSLCEHHSVCAIGGSNPSNFDELLTNARKLDGIPAPAPA